VSIIPEIERQLRDAAERRAQSPLARAIASSRRLRGRLLARPLVVAVALVAGGTGAAFAAKALVGVGSPAPLEYPSFGEKILPTGTRLLSLRVPDPAGGPPWGMRLIFTTARPGSRARPGAGAGAGAAHWGCVQVGRVVDGQLGILGQDGAFHDDGLFHALPVQPESCGGLSSTGQLLGLTGEATVTSSANRALEGCLTSSARREQQMALPSIQRELAVAKAEHDPAVIRSAREGLATYRRLEPVITREPACPEADLRVLAFGVAGPHARSVTITGERVRRTITLNPADDGAYLVVGQPSRLQQMRSALRSEDLALEVQALRRTVEYENGHSCPEESSPSCLAPLGTIRYGRPVLINRPPAGGSAARRPTPRPTPATALSRRAERDPATPNPVTITPRTGGPHTTFTLTFRALLNGGGYSYLIRAGGATACQRAAERATGGDGVAVGGPPIVRGQSITKTLKPPPRGLCPGRYRVYVAYSNPEAQHLQNFPFATVTFLVSGSRRRSLFTRRP
jgi:hypothetical protein